MGARQFCLYVPEAPDRSELSRSTADEEPLVDRSVDLGRREVLVGRQRRQLLRRDTARRVANGEVGAGQWC